MPTYDGLDNPGSDPKEDAFNRWPFSKRLADTIAEFDTSNGAPIFGIFGKWGYGKSTVLNYIKREFETTHRDKVVLFEFNPWLFTTEEELITAFLIGLTSKLQQSLGSGWKDFGNLLEKGSGLFGMIPLVGSGAQKFTETLGKEIAKDSLQSQRERAIEIMRKATRTVVVLIDDLDRLDPQEILTMLRLVRLNGNLPRVAYVLAFDDAMVARAAGARYGNGPDSGRQFLEKIVQYPFTLPAVGLRRLVDFVIRHARDACTAADVKLSADEWKEFERLVDRHFSRRLTTPRQAIRYANALRFALPLLKGEVSAFDQMLVEGVRVLFPEIYAHLRDDVRSVTSFASNDMILDLNAEAMRTYAKTLMQSSPPSEIVSVVEVIMELFDDPSRPKTIKRVRYFDRYFSYAVPGSDISDSALVDALHANRGAEELVALFKRLAAPDPGRLLHALSALRPQLQPQAILAASNALARNGELFISKPEELLTESSLPTFDPLSLQMVNVLIQLAFDLSKMDEQRDRAIIGIIEAAEPLEIAIVFYRQLRNLFSSVIKGLGHSKDLWKAIGLSEAPHLDEVTEGVQRVLATSIGKRFHTFAATNPERLFNRGSDGPQLLSEWCSVPGDGAKIWLREQFIALPADGIRFLKLTSVDNNGFWFAQRPVEYVVDPGHLSDVLNRYLAATEAGVEFSSEDLALARRFIAIWGRPSHDSKHT